LALKAFSPHRQTWSSTVVHKVRRLSCVLLSDEGPPGLPPSTANREAGPAAGGKRKARHTLAAWPGKTKRRLTIRTLDQRPQGRKLDCVDPDSFGELASALFKAEGERDREWFERHPARNYRVRRMTRGEMIFLGTPPGAVAYCAVRQPVVRLWPDHANNFLCVAEGAETALYAATQCAMGGPEGRWRSVPRCAFYRRPLLP